jgi:hypothetical protein
MSSLGKCPKCGQALINFNYVVNSLGKENKFIGIKCSSKECNFKTPQDAKEV